MKRAAGDPNQAELQAIQVAVRALEWWGQGRCRAAIQLVREAPELQDLPDSHIAMTLLRRNPALTAALRGQIDEAHRCLGRELAVRLRDRLAERQVPPRRLFGGLRLPWERTLVLAATSR